MSFGKVHGLRDVGQYKLYEKRVSGKIQIFIGHQPTPQKMRRVTITRDIADKARGLPRANFAEFCQQMLEGAKLAGSPNYYER